MQGNLLGFCGAVKFELSKEQTKDLFSSHLEEANIALRYWFDVSKFIITPKQSSSVSKLILEDTLTVVVPSNMLNFSFN